MTRAYAASPVVAVVAGVAAAVLVAGCGGSARSSASTAPTTPGGTAAPASTGSGGSSAPSAIASASASAGGGTTGGLLPSTGGSFGTGSSTVPAGTVVSAGCGSGSVTLAVGARLRLVGCRAGTRASVLGQAVALAGPYTVRAVHTGSATVQLSGGAVCAAGQTCPQYRTFVGRVVVTVR